MIIITKAIIFDLGGVLFTNGTKQFIEDLSQRYSLDHEVVKNVMDGEIGTEYREGKISRLEFWKKVKDILNLDEDIDKLEDKWIDGYKLIQGTKDIILELKNKYKLYYLSDNVRERVDKINKVHNFISLFDGGVFSHEAGVRKPNVEIYKIVLKKANVNGNEAVFIDDKPPFLEPAKELGMAVFAFEHPERLREDLVRAEIL